MDRILGNELSLSLTDPAFQTGYSIFLQNISHAPPILASIFTPLLREWLKESVSSKANSNSSHFEQNLGQALKILITNGNDADRQFVETISKEQLGLGLELRSACVWLSALFQVEPTTGVAVLEQGLNKIAPSKEGLAVELISKVFNGDPIGGVNLGSIASTPALLLRLVRLCYRHVRVQDDAHHIGSFTPDLRDDAERARNLILGALLETTGIEGWAAKLEMAEDPLFAHFRDRAIALAQQKAAEEADNVTLAEADYIVLDETGESPPLTRDDMFALLRNRLDDIEDLLLQDASPRELWATIKVERLLRREIARELKDRSNLCYTVDQEGATADEKETDIRLRSTRSNQQGVIELKRADQRPGTDLFVTLEEQLLKKYMAPEECRAGCLLITIARDRTWEHPITGKSIGFENLIEVLQKEAERLSENLGGAVKLMARGLDLRPRLAAESEQRPLRAIPTELTPLVRNQM